MCNSEFVMFTKYFARLYTRKGGHCGKLFLKRQYSQTVDNVMTIVPVSQVKQSLKQFSLPVVDGHTCIIADCPLCQQKKKESKIYVNKTTGYFICGNCKCTGPWSTLKNLLSDTKTDLKVLKENLTKQEDFTDKWKDLKKTCQVVSEMPENEYSLMLLKFSFPNVPQADMSKLDCIYDNHTDTLYFPIRALRNSLVGYQVYSLASDTGKTVPASGIGGCITYKSDTSAKAANNAVVVATVPDLLVLIAQKIKATIICLPYALQNLPQQLLPALESYKRLTLWLGNDEASWNVSRSFAKKLNEKRCYFVRPKDLQPPPRLAAEMGLDMQKILQAANPIWHESIITFQQLREDVLSDLQNVEKVQGVKWKRYPTLNKILGGHRRGEFTVLTGPTGCGKTTFMSEYSLDLAMQGVNTLWGSFEIRNVRLVRTMLQQMAEVPLDQNLEKFNHFADQFEKLPLYFMTFHGQQNIKVVMDAVQHATYVHDIAHVIIDNVQFMMGTSDQTEHMDRFWKQDNIVAKFRNFATTCNCHVTLVIHPRKERENEELTTSSIFGSAKASQEADNILIIQDKRLSSVRGKKFLQVAKNRYSGDLGIMSLDFNKESLSYAQKKGTKKKKSDEQSIER